MKVRCGKCSGVVYTDCLEVKQEILDEKKGDSALYVECPECESKIYIEVNNAYTIMLNKKLLKLTKKMERLRHAKKFSNSVYKEAMLTIKKLKVTQAFLMNRYKGKIELAEVVRDEGEV